ncbi:MAG: DUF1858 domain-containing protein [Faecalibacterium sp.]|nr:DUF1858 domain-containing protein [Ruminococcus sp.]MCM1392347.1 DUF1858 domain-containing protein [Ruminococcus sp.]MCM1484657.1 DUF1858 domain-containing protein [Faecalibacterium sp.]
MKEITKEMLIGDILNREPGVAMLLFELGMPCLGCPSANNESVEQACAIHEINVDDLLHNINEYLSAR